MIYAGLDVGTTNCKITIFENDNVIDSILLSYPSIRNENQQTIDPLIILKTVKDLISKSSKKYLIEGIGITSFGETCVFLDEFDQVILPSLLYTDTRGEKEANEIEDLIGKLNLGKKDKEEKKPNKILTSLFSTNFKGKLDKVESWTLRTMGGVLILIIVYAIFAMFLNSEIAKKTQQIGEVRQDTLNQISLINADITSLKNKTSEYQSMSENLRNISNQVSENNKNRNNIPNLLTQLRHSMPQGVQITSIENTNTKHIIIQAQSQKYEQLGYFKAILKTQGILSPDTVVSTTGEKSGDIVKVVIEGDLP